MFALAKWIVLPHCKHIHTIVLNNRRVIHLTPSIYFSYLDIKPSYTMLYTLSNSVALLLMVAIYYTMSYASFNLTFPTFLLKVYFRAYRSLYQAMHANVTHCSFCMFQTICLDSLELIILTFLNCILLS